MTSQSYRRILAMLAVTLTTLTVWASGCLRGGGGGGPLPHAVPPEDGSSNTADSAQTSDSTNTEADGADGQTGGGTSSSIRPRWILYDGNDSSVEAIVEPWVKRDDATAFDPTRSFNCVKVLAKGTQPMRVLSFYELQSGQMLPCYSEYRSDLIYYQNSDCTGQMYVPDYVSYTLRIDDQMYWPQGAPRQAKDTLYKVSDGTCVVEQYGKIVRQVTPVPDSRLNVLPNPPYTVEPRYD